MQNLRALNLLTLPKTNTKRFGLYSFCFRFSYSWNHVYDNSKNKTSVKAFKNELAES